VLRYTPEDEERGRVNNFGYGNTGEGDNKGEKTKKL
jgi:hypothetical protein